MKVEIEVPEGFELAHFQLKRVHTKAPLTVPEPVQYEQNPKENVWATVNWDESNYEIAEKTGKSYATVLNTRRAVGHPPLRTKKMAHVDWRNLDWQKNNQQIAAENHVDANTVRNIRIRLKAPVSVGHKGWSRKITDEMILAVDWEFTRDMDISKLWHVSRERVRQIRQQRNFPVCTIGFRDSMSREFAKWLKQNAETIKGKIARDVADSCPINLDMYRRLLIMKKSGIPFIFRGLRQSIALKLPVNWELPNILLDNIWDKNKNWASNCRVRYSLDAPKYNSCFVPIAEFVNLNGLQPLILAEMEKAKALNITPRNPELLTKLVG